MSPRRRSQRDVEEEMRAHLDLEADRLVAEGMRPGDARIAARKRFGNVAAAQERYHDTAPLQWLEQLGADVRYAARALRSAPMFAIAAVLALALGIGANTAVFSVVNGVLLSGLPYRQPDRLVELWETLPHADRIMVSYPDFLDWKTRNRVFDDIALYSPFGGAANTTGDVPKQLDVGTATSNFFELLGVAPLVGRTFAREDDQPGGDPVALLGEGYWRSEYAADPAVIGRTISLNGEPHRIVGVLPKLAGFKALEVWLPLRPDLDTASFGRGNHPGLIGIGRLKPGVTLQQMRADLDRVSRQIVADHPADASGIGAGGDQFGDLLVRDIRPALEMMSWAVLCVLLIACVNVANLVLGRAVARRREIAVRRALGAGESRVLRLLVVENLLLAVVGGVLGIALAYAGVRALVAARPPGIPRLTNIHVDVRVLAFAIAVSFVTGIVFGLLPARHAASADLNDSLKDSSRGASASGSALRLRGMLMTLEVAMALALLVGAGLLGRSFLKLMHVDPGIDPTGVVTGWIGLPTKRYAGDERQRLAMNDILHRVETVPGVTSAALTSALALSGNMQYKFTFEGHPRTKGQEPLLQVQLITAGYFRTMGIRLLGGRAFGPTDVHGGTPVAWIDDAIAKRFFPDENPVGKWIVHGGLDSAEPKLLVAGVVSTVHDGGLDEAANGIVYLPFDQNPQSWMALALKTTLPLEQVMPAVRRRIASVDKRLPLSNEQTMTAVIDQSVAGEKLLTFVLGAFAVVSLLLAAVGVYGVIAYFVAQRSHEIGIRMALGASRRQIVGLVSRRVFMSASAGIVMGLLVATAASGLLAKLLYEVRPVDPATYAVGSLALLVVATLAALVPTLRATRVNPVRAMRAE